MFRVLSPRAIRQAASVSVSQQFSAQRFSARPAPNGQSAHRNLVYSETPARVIAGGIQPNLSVHLLTDPKTRIQQEVYLLPMPGCGIVAAGTVIEAGSAYENAKNNGLFHFTEHMMFKRSGNGQGKTQFRPGDYDRLMSHNLLMSNASTSRDYLMYYFAGRAESLAEGLKANAFLLQDPRFLKRDIRPELGAVLNEMGRDRDQLEERLDQHMMMDLYAPHPYSYSILGSEQVLKALPLNSFADFFYRHYGPQNRKHLIVGDFKPDAVLKTLAEHYNLNPERFSRESLNASVSARPKPAPRTEAIRRTFYEEEVGRQDARVIWGFRGPKATDSRDNLTFQLIARLLGASNASTTYQSIRERPRQPIVRQLDYGIDDLKDAGSLLIEADCSPASMPLFETRMGQRVKAIKAGQFSPRELHILKRELQSEYMQSQSGPLDRWEQLAEQIAHQTVDQLYGDRFLRLLSGITAGDIRRVAKTYLTPGRKVEYHVLSKTLQPESVVPPRLTKASKSAAAAAHSDPVRFSGTLPADAIRYRTPEGMTVVIQRPLPHDHRQAVALTAPAGTAIEQFRGEQLLMGMMMAKRTKHLSTAKFADQLAQNGINIGVSVRGELFRLFFTGDSTRMKGKSIVANDPYSFNRMMALASEMLTEPAYPNADLQREKQDLIAEKRQDLAESPDTFAAAQHAKLFFPPASRYRSSDYEISPSFKAINSKRLAECHWQIFRPENLTMTIVSNLETDKLRQGVARLSKAIAAASRRHPPRMQPLILHPPSSNAFRQNRLRADVWKNGTISQTRLHRSWPAPSLSHPEDSAALMLLEDLLNSPTGRLWKTFREGQDGGLCYETAAQYDSDFGGGGRFNLYIDTAHETLPRVLHLFDEQMDRLLTDQPVTPSEFRRAKAEILLSGRFSRFKLEDQAIGTGAHLVLNIPSGLDRTQMIEAMRLKDFQAILQRLFKGKPSLTTLLTSPETAHAMQLPEDRTVSYDRWKLQYSGSLNPTSPETKPSIGLFQPEGESEAAASGK